MIGGLVLGLASGVIGGLGMALAFGGYACLSHVAFRLILWHGGAMPMRYVRFLDESVSRSLLRRVGGGYSFGHRLLLDWFAKQYTGPETHPGSLRMPTVPNGGSDAEHGH